MRTQPTNNGTLVITTPAPTPNGQLHLGHLAGPFVAADVAARAARLTGRHVRTVTGLDSHQNHVRTKAGKLGLPAGTAKHGFAQRIGEAFDRYRLDYDIVLDPAEDTGARAAVVRLITEMLDRGTAVVEDTDLQVCSRCGRTLHHAYVHGRCPACGLASGGEACERCAGYITAGNLLDARSTCCAARPRTLRTPLPVLRLEDHRAALLETWTRAGLPPRVADLIGRQLDQGLPVVPLAYPTDSGIPLDGHPGLRVDVWVEMGLAYLHAVARDISPGVRSLDEHRAAWEYVGELWQFLGIDNAFYYAILYPALFAAAGLPARFPRGLVVNEFYRLDGEKFSTSRDHAIWALDFAEAEDPAMVRLFLCQDRPDQRETSFTMAAYRAFCRQAWTGGGTGDVDLARAEHALSLAAFDPALAVRCLFPALAGTTDPRARRLLSAITGTEPS